MKFASNGYFVLYFPKYFSDIALAIVRDLFLYLNTFYNTSTYLIFILFFVSLFT